MGIFLELPEYEMALKTAIPLIPELGQSNSTLDCNTWLLRLTVKILAILRLTVNFFL